MDHEKIDAKICTILSIIFLNPTCQLAANKMSFIFLKVYVFVSKSMFYLKETVKNDQWIS